VQALRKLDQFEDVVHAAADQVSVEQAKAKVSPETVVPASDMFAEEGKPPAEGDDAEDEGSEDPALDSTQLF